MIQVTTHLEVADNSGARIVKCIKVDRDGKIRLSRREALDAAESG